MGLSKEERELIRQHRANEARKLRETQLAALEANALAIRLELYGPACTCDQQWTDPKCPARRAGLPCD